MGAGKTTLGAAVAKSAAARFVDLDDYIEQQQGMTISQIFATCGEPRFRQLESQALEQLATESVAGIRPTIIACGGGTPCHNGNIDRMNTLGTTIYLEASIDKLVSRLTAERSRRPLIASMTSAQLPEYINAALSQRLPHYSKAMARFNADNLDSAEQIEQSVALFIDRFLPNSNQ